MTHHIPLDTYGRTDVGPTRENNEDNVLWYPPGELSQEQIAGKGILYLVADGVGGHQAGEVASQMVVEIVRDQYYADPNPDVGGSLRAAIEEANRQVYRASSSNDRQYGMASTITAIALHNNYAQLTVANVGDSRTYLIRSGQIHQLTTDHSWVNEQVQAGVLTPEEAKTHPQRNVVTRSIGSKFEVQVDVFHQQVGNGDAILLCSDGLTDVVADEEIKNAVLRHKAQGAVEQLIQMVYARTGPDNVSVITVNIGKRGRSAAPPVAAGGKSGNKMLIFGLAFIAALIAAALVFLLFGKNSSAPPAPGTLQANVNNSGATPSPAPSPAPPKIDIDPTGEPTATPNAQLTLQAPEDNRVFQPTEQIKLQWDWPLLSEGEQFHLAVQGAAGRIADEILSAPEFTFDPGRLPSGAYTWLVLVEKEGAEIARSAPRHFSVAAPPAATLPPTKAATIVADEPGTIPPPPPAGAKLPAPTLIKPENNASFTSSGEEIVFQWAAAPRPLAADEYYVLIIHHREGDDRSWTKDTSYSLQQNDKSWLFGKTNANSELSWKVVIAKKRGDDDSEDPAGYETSDYSEKRVLRWSEGGEPPKDDDGGGNGDHPEG